MRIATPVAILTSLLLVGLKAATQPPFQNKGITKEIRIVPEAAEVGIPASEVMDSVEYIPLETTRESLFGSAYRLAVTKDYFIVLDQESTKSVLLFHKDGKFYKRNDRYEGHQYLTPQELFTNKANNDFIVMGNLKDSRGNLFWYDKDGKELSAPDKGFFDDLHVFPNGNTLLAYDPEQPVSLLMDDSAGKRRINLMHTLVPGLTNEDYFGRDKCFFPDTDTTVFFLRNYDLNVYRVSQSGRIDTPYRFILPADKMPPSDLLTNPAYKGKRLDIASGKTFAVKFFTQIEKLQLFNISGIFFYLMVYNPATGMLWSVADVKPDKRSYDLPVFTKAYYNGYTTDGNCIYSTLSSLEMMEAANKISGKPDWQTTLPPNLKAYFQKGDRDANPVVTVLHFKQ